MSTASTVRGGDAPDGLPAASSEVGRNRTIRKRYPLQWALSALVILIGVGIIVSAVTNKAFGWPIVAAYFFSPQILAGLVVTLELTVLSMACGVVLGTLLAVMRLSSNRVLSGASSVYVWFFRATPLLVQLIFWYNISALFPHLAITIPFGATYPIDTNVLINGFVAAVLALSLNEAAYMSEIIRAGIQSVDEGQAEAAAALGMTRRKTMWLITFPQAMRVIIPPTGNQTIGMLKTTSLVSFVAVADLLYATQLIYARTFETIPMLIMVSIWYLLLTSVLGVGQYFLERRFGRGATRTRVPTPRERLSGLLASFSNRQSDDGGVR